MPVEIESPSQDFSGHLHILYEMYLKDFPFEKIVDY